MNYSEWVAAIGQATGQGAEDDSLATLLTPAIEYAEGRIYRDPNFNFLATHGSDQGPLTIGSRQIAMPTGIIIAEQVNLITPAGALPDASGSKRTPLARMTLAYINAVWGDLALTGQPVCYAPLTDREWRVAPVPDAGYVLEWVGTQQPTPLSESNPTTFITTYMPELFFAASMVFLTGALMKNYGAQADDPGSAMSWEAQFNLLKTGPQVEEARRKSLSTGGTALPPAPLATGG